MKTYNLESPADLQIFFTNKISQFIDNASNRMMGWNEILGENVHGWQEIDQARVKEQLAQSAIIHFWKGNLELINKSCFWWL